VTLSGIGKKTCFPDGLIISLFLFDLADLAKCRECHEWAILNGVLEHGNRAGHNGANKTGIYRK
jgi:hypothetical protein